ncbi:hypothetical protein [Azonexus sp.]|jgi:hypothetical protein|uniref:hypothetical protein n=1 Tax=Azonexus sp. TaxID=1872668 RepID=UPI002837145A|nr:hypothetical protein [Azonexus sp.]MDR1994328.1 hypothetical protein [Azonexus sp.]
MKITSALAGTLVFALVVTGCASKVKASRTDNPPPIEAYSKFGRIEIKPVTLAPEFRGQSANEKSLEKINANFFKRLGDNPKKWNERPDNGRTLVIEPIVTDIRFIGVGARIFTGPLSGSSGVVIHIKATEVSTGKLIDHPEFYQRSSAGAGFALGVADNLMLTRIGELVGDYLLRNYDAPIGGKTGATDELVSADTKAANEYR